MAAVIGPVVLCGSLTYFQEERSPARRILRIAWIVRRRDCVRSTPCEFLLPAGCRVWRGRNVPLPRGDHSHTRQQAARQKKRRLNEADARSTRTIIHSFPGSPLQHLLISIWNNAFRKRDGPFDVNANMPVTMAGIHACLPNMRGMSTLSYGDNLDILQEHTISSAASRCRCRRRVPRSSWFRL
jgi:hypothetical protein